MRRFLSLWLAFALMIVSLAVGPAAAAADGSISGTVTVEGGGPLEGIQVNVYDMNWNYAGGWGTESDGSYSVTGLAAGDYKVEFDDQSDSYPDEWYSDASDFYSATPVPVTAGGLVTVDAELAVPGSITGTVTVEGSDPLVGIANVNVTVYDENYSWVSNTQTDVDGSFTVTGFGTGSYRIEFQSDSYPDEWYSDASDFYSATPVPVTAGGLVTVDAELAVPGSITGTVTVEGSGPLEGAYVDVYDSAYSWIASRQTDTDGVYTVTGLRPGGYKVRYSGSRPEVWFGGTSDFASATTVEVASGGTSEASFAYPGPGTISGTVVDDSTGLPLGGVTVSARTDTGMGWEWETVGIAVSRVEDGMYTIPSVDPGEYAVYFEADGYAGELWNDHVGPFSRFVNLSDNLAEIVTVGDREDVGNIDAALVQSGSIQGYVRDDVTNGAIHDMRVTVHAADGSWSQETWTGDTGHYAFTNLAPGDYKISFDAWDTAYLPEWADDQPTFYDATPLTVTPGSELAVDGYLTRGGTISGTIRNSTGELIVDASASVVDSTGIYQTTAWTGEDGRYTVVGLATGSYRISSDVFGGVGSDLPVWYGQVANEWEATLVPVVVREHVTGIDMQHRAGGTIAGTATEPDGTTPVQGIPVAVYTMDGNRLYEPQTSTDENGEYLLGGIETGNYLVHFEGDIGHQQVWYGNATTMGEATPVAVVAGEDTTGIDFVSEPASVQLSGTVTDHDGIALDGVGVDAYRVEDFEAAVPGATTVTNEEGYYELAVPPGEFTVLFRPDARPDLLTEWYNNQEEWRFADPVTVVAGIPVTGIDAQLDEAGAIAGTVTDGTNPIEGVTVRVPRPKSWPFGDSRDLVTTTGADGVYRIDGLFPGTYAVAFEHPEFANEWYADAATELTSTPVAVSGGSDTTGIDAVLGTGGTIAGTLDSGAASSYPIEVYTAGGELVASIVPDGDGPYEISGVPAGTYYVRLRNQLPQGISQWFGGDYTDWWEGAVPSAGHGTPVTVTEGNVVQGVDFGASSVSTISGTITDDETGDPIGDIDVWAWIDGRDDWGVSGDEVQYGENGQFTVYVGPGTYALGFEDIAWSRYATEWWNDVASRSPTTEITLGVGESLTGLEVGLSHWSGVSGTVTSDVGPVNLVNIELYDAADPTLPVDVIRTVPVGTYGDGRVFPGEYKLRLVDPTGLLFDPIWYDARSSHLSAETVTLAPGQISHDIDFNIDEPINEETVTGEVPQGGGTVESGDGIATSEDPIETAVVVPEGSVSEGETETVTITEVPVDDGTINDGYDLLGTKVIIESPPAPDGAWLELVLTLDATLVPEGEDETTVEVFRNGGLVEDCLAPEALGPDPCVASREGLGDGDLRFTIFTSAASEWTFGTPIPPPIALGDISVSPMVPIPNGTEVALTFEATFTDNTRVVIDWGDETVPGEWTAMGLDTLPPFTHTYDVPGVHTIGVALIDGSTELSATYEYVVVYDSSGSFVTGGGWIGASEVGRMSFGLNARYDKNDVPVGSVEAHVFDQNFRSNQFNWLVITPDGIAEVSGLGTYEGSTDRPFRIELGDGSDGDVEGVRRFRIWASGADMFRDAPIVDVGGALGGGEIKIHRKR